MRKFLVSAAGYDKLQPGRGPNSDIASNRKADGLLYGGNIGYDADLGQVVIGAEGEVTGSTGDVSNTPRSAGAFSFGRLKEARDLHARVRADAKVTPQTLLYAKGGYTNAWLHPTANNGATTTPALPSRWLPRRRRGRAGDQPQRPMPSSNIAIRTRAMRGSASDAPQ